MTAAVAARESPDEERDEIERRDCGKAVQTYPDQVCNCAMYLRTYVRDEIVLK